MSNSVAAEAGQQLIERRGAWRWLAREIFGIFFLAAILFGGSGHFDWSMAWWLLGVYVVWIGSTALLLMPNRPGVLAERAQRRFSEKRWDTVILALFGMTSMAKYIIAALDFRYGWTQSFSLPVQVGGMIVAILGYGLVTWGMTANAFFSMVNRIQSERGHSVATTGPYRYIRHPGYLGSILFDLGTPFMLNSLWALIFGIASALLMAMRTAWEDQSLRDELQGYSAYARQTHYRLIPGIW